MGEGIFIVRTQITERKNGIVFHYWNTQYIRLSQYILSRFSLEVSQHNVEGKYLNLILDIVYLEWCNVQLMVALYYKYSIQVYTKYDITYPNLAS